MMLSEQLKGAAEIDRLRNDLAEAIEALKPFARITRSSLYSESENERYQAVLSYEADFTGQEISRARAIVEKHG